MKTLTRNVTRHEPCPICGKPDWCFWGELNNSPGLYYLCCQRSSEAKGVIVAGFDGKEYVAIRARETGTTFEERTQRTNRLKQTNQEQSGKVKKPAERHMTVIDCIDPLPNQELDRIYSAILKELPLYRFHVNYLLNEGWNMDLIRKVGVKSLPASECKNLPPSLRNEWISREDIAQLAKESLNRSLIGTPGVYVGRGGRETFNAASGIIFPVRDLNGKIYRIRNRRDFIDVNHSLSEDANGFFYMDNDGCRVDVGTFGAVKHFPDGTFQKIGGKAKYNNFSSFKLNPDAYKAGFIENSYPKGCEAGNRICFADLFTKDTRASWISEGEKKAYFGNYVLKQMFIGLPGVNNIKLLETTFEGTTILNHLQMRGVKIFIIAYDADSAVNIHVLTARKALANLLISHGFQVFIATWDMALGKGIDDLLAAGRVPAFVKAVS